MAKVEAMLGLVAGAEETKSMAGVGDEAGEEGLVFHFFYLLGFNF